MAERFRFFDSIDGEEEREYTADEFAEYFRQFIRNGIFSGGENLKVETNEQDMKVFINPGYAWIEGYLYKIDTEPLVMEHKIADPSLNRIDRIVIRLDKTLENRYVKAFILEGTPAATPEAPELTRNNNVYEISLAQVEVIAGKSFIESYQITDERFNNGVCGIVTHLFEQVDTTDIFNQYEQVWNKWFIDNTEEFKSQFLYWFGINTGEWGEDFETWFKGIKEQLEGEVETALLEEINEIRNTRTLPIDIKDYNKVSQWADILIPDEDRGRGLLEFLFAYGGSSEQIAGSEEAMLVIMQEYSFNKCRQVPVDYEQIIWKLGVRTEVGKYLTWIEELLADYTRGMEKLKLGLVSGEGSREIASNEYALRVIMEGEREKGLIDYRRKLVG